jgi:hypothetical protein
MRLCRVFIDTTLLSIGIMISSVSSYKFRKGSIVIATDETSDGTFERVGKAIEIVQRANYENDGEYESITVFKMHYNGQVYVIPTKNLRKATAEEKRSDPKENVYGHSSALSQHINLSNVRWVPKATPFAG